MLENNNNPNFLITNWRHQERISNSSYWKVLLYDLIRPLISVYARRNLSRETKNLYKPDFVIFERGFPLQSRRKWAINGRDLSDKSVLVQGTGTGWDIISWAKLKPRRIIGVDLYQFKNSWSEISDYCNNNLQVDVSFIQGSLDDMAFLDDESIDFCASDAVYEHCQNLSNVMSETMRVLKPGGIVYASYGPLWYCATGDHYARGGLENVYNHLLLDPLSYEAYFRKFLSIHEDFQSGGRYVDLKLFSYFRTADYLRIFQESGFIILNFVLEISKIALKFSKKYPQKFDHLIKKYSEVCIPDDFKIKGNFVRLKKPQI